MCLTTTEAANLGTLFSGIGACIQGISMLAALIWGFLEFNRWKKSKILEKKSNIAESILNDLVKFYDEFGTWLFWANSWFIYDKQSPENLKKLNSLTDSEKKEFEQRCAIDKYELENYAKMGYEILGQMSLIKHKVLRLSDPVLNQKIEEFDAAIKKAPQNLHTQFRFPEKDIQKEARQKLLSTKENLKQYHDEIHEKLVKHLLFTQEEEKGNS